MYVGDHVLHDLLPHIGDGLLDRLVVHKVDALLEDDLALIVHHIVEFEQVFARIEVARLDLLLGLFQRPVDPGVGDGLIFLDAELAQHVVHALGAEDAHQVVFKREVEFGGARVALAARTAAKLVVDAPAFMALGAEHIEPAGSQRDLLLLLDIGVDLRALSFDLLRRGLPSGRLALIDPIREPHGRVAAELDVRAAARHVGGDGHGARHARLRDDARFLLVIARVQDLMRDLERLQQFGQRFGFLDGRGADQDGLVPLVALLDQGDDRLVLLLRRPVDLVVAVDADHRPVRRDFQRFELVDVLELGGLGQRGAGHARELARRDGSSSGR